MLRDFVEYAPIDDTDPDGVSLLMTSSYADTVAAPARPQDRRYIAVLSALVRELADRGDVLIVGHGAQALLQERSDTVHVRVVCDLDERIRRVAEREVVSLEEARSRIQYSDRRREAWHRKYFQVDYASPYLYDLILNTACVSDSLAAEAIVRIVEGLESGPQRAVLPREA